jgi:sugar phosphate isomerase/epimerase
MSCTRRDFLAGSAGIFAGTLLNGCANQNSCRSKQNSPYKLGVCDWSMKLKCDPAVMKKAKLIGFDGVQLSLGSIKDDMKLRKPELQKLFLEESKHYDIEIASLGIGDLNLVPYKSEPIAEKWVSDSIDVCRNLNVKIVLLAFFAKGDLLNDEKGKDQVVKKLKKVAPKAEDAGVTLGLENWLSADENMEIIDRVNSPAVKVYYDVGNSTKMGYDIFKEIRSLGPNICEFHAKDYKGLFGVGEIDFTKVRSAMDDINYHGWIQSEPVVKPLGIEGTCQYNLGHLRTIF